MSIHDGPKPHPTQTELDTAIWGILRDRDLPYKWTGADDFEPAPADTYDHGNQGADLLEARETTHREGRQ